LSTVVSALGSKSVFHLKFIGKSLGLGVCAASLIALGGPSSAAPIKSIVAFGDSLTDIGNNRTLFGTTSSSSITGNSFIPIAPYESGTYSNGPIWANYLATTLGLPPLAPSLSSPAGGGAVFAYGGARVNAPTPGVPPFLPLLSIQQQIDGYLAGKEGNTASPNALYAIAGGGNDARDTLTTTLPAFLGGAPIQDLLADILADASIYAIDVESQVNQLRAAGATDLLVWNVPNLGLTPSVLGLGIPSGFASNVAIAFNNALTNQISGIPGVTLFDAFGFSSTALTSSTSPFAAQGPVACGALQSNSCNDYFFWDGLHPTTAAHSSIAQAIYVNLGSPTPVPGPLPILGAAAAFGYSRKLKKRIKNNRQPEVSL
jgi:outer membrane lipase/esterase